MPRAATERTASLDGAAALLALAMHDSYAPVEQLASALERMASVLERCAPALQGEVAQDAIEREIAVCIESLQFHDRLMQRLAHVRDCLADLTGSRPSPGSASRSGDLTTGSIELF